MLIGKLFSLIYLHRCKNVKIILNIMKLSLLLLLLLFGVRCARPGESENTVQRPQPHTANP